MFNLILFGPPGAGKGTQSELLKQHFNLHHISTGDLFRHHTKNETELGILAKTYTDKGKLVPDEVTIEMLKTEIHRLMPCEGFIFDGFPRTQHQAEQLDLLLQSFDAEINHLLALDVPEKELIGRLLARGKDSGRQDDQSTEIIQQRLQVYHKQTAEVAKHYAQFGKSTSIDGVGSVDQVQARLIEHATRNTEKTS